MLRTITFVAMMLLANSAFAQTYKVDDTGTVVTTPMVDMEMGDLRVNSGFSYGKMNIDVRLNVSEWVGKKGDIYLRFGDSVTSGWTAKWESRKNEIRGGSLSFGDRRLVYSGVITSRTMTDFLSFDLFSNGTYEINEIEFIFEIDVK